MNRKSCVKLPDLNSSSITGFIKTKTLKSVKKLNLIKANTSQFNMSFNIDNHRLSSIEKIRLITKKALVCDKKLIRPTPDQKNLVLSTKNLLLKPIVELKSPSSYSSDSEEDLDLITILKTTCEDIIEVFLTTAVPLIADEGLKALLNASMMIYATSISDKYLTEMLERKVKNTINETIDEIKNHQLIEIKTAIITQVMIEHLYDLVYRAFDSIISEDVFEDYFAEVSVIEVIVDSISELNMETQKLIDDIYKDLVDQLLTEDWVEILLEDEIVKLKLKKNYKLLPPNIQELVAVNIAQDKISEIIEEIYFDMVFEYVGDLWVQKIANECYYRKAFEDSDILNSMNRMRDLKKKLTTNCNIAKYYMCQ